MELVIHMKRRENHYTCIYIENSQVFYPRKLYTCTYYRYVSVVPGKATGTCSTEAVRVNKSPDQTPATHTAPSSVQALWKGIHLDQNRGRRTVYFTIFLRKNPNKGINDGNLRVRRREKVKYYIGK